MRAKSVLLLMLALGCGLVASIGITQVMAKRSSEVATSAGDMDAIFVAMEDIPMGEPITAQMIKLEEWPKGRVPEGALAKIEDVQNRRPKAKIYKGSPILENQLLSRGASELGASGQIPKGYRVVPVKVDIVSGGSSMILPGDRVDVLVHLRRGQDVQETTTRTILQDIRVFAVNDVFDLDSSDGTEKITAQTISLLVPLDQAERIILATELGQIRLVLRSPEDDEEVTTKGAKPRELFGASESADREQESLFPPHSRTELAGAKDFIDFLNSQQSGASAAVNPAKAANSWRMRKIEGSEVSEVVLESDEEGLSPNGSASGFSLWRRMISSVARAGRDAAKVAPNANQATMEREQAEPQQDEQEDRQQEAEEADGD